MKRRSNGVVQMGVNRRRGFTLIELLVVIAVIAMLAAMLLPVLSKTKAAARCTCCISNLKQINLGVLMYADDHNQRLPTRFNLVPGVKVWSPGDDPFLLRGRASTSLDDSTTASASTEGETIWPNT